MKIAIVEVSESHEECIYIQVKFLTDAGHSVHLILNPALKNQVKAYESLCDAVSYINPVKKGFFPKLKQQLRLLKQLKAFDKIVFNTASSSKMVRNLAFFLTFYPMECIGLLHNTKRLRSSFTQKIISLKIKKYFVLNDYLLSSGMESKGIALERFYPIYFPYKTTPKKLEKNIIWISIPGRIDYNRRVYSTLMDCLTGIKQLKNIKFLILGKLDKNSDEGARFCKEIAANHLDTYFMLFNKFITNEDYHSYLRESDFIMPLLKTDNDYLKHKISGSFNLAFAYRKPLLCHKYFSTIPDLEENAHFFDANSLEELLKSIDKGDFLKKNTYVSKKWDYEPIKKRYLDFILS